ncbi:hypothetical protein DFH06DRAFT_1255348 [Mycena polygramma]|nr:hypothetical protein DFH06DRAFT_1255348 [Mycena polygramma]
MQSRTHGPSHRIFQTDYFGTEWNHYGRRYRPYQHPEEILAEAPDERHSDCSEALDSHLSEFYQDIRPLLTVSSFDSASVCTLYAEYVAQKTNEMQEPAKIEDFRRRTKERLTAWFRACCLASTSSEACVCERRTGGGRACHGTYDINRLLDAERAERAQGVGVHMRRDL